LIILYIKEEKNVIIQRLIDRDKDKDKNTKWVENFLKKWYPEFDPPSKEESDYFIEITPKNINQAIKKIEKIISG
jgi:thymidylate kinase